MAIAASTTADCGLANPGTSLTKAMTLSGSNLALVVGLFLETTDAITGVTWGGVALTQASKVLTPGASGRYQYIYYLLAAAAGTADVVISTGSSVQIGGVAASYTGVDSGGLAGTSGSNTTTGTSLTGTMTTTADNSWMVMNALATSQAVSPSTGCANRQSWTLNDNMRLVDSNAAITPAGSYSETVTIGSSAGFSVNFLALAPAGSGITGPLVGFGHLGGGGPLIGGRLVRDRIRGLSANAPIYQPTLEESLKYRRAA